jgi:hypothetical protein
VPLSDVTFADEAGRTGTGFTAAPLAPAQTPPARKRVAATRSAGERRADA